MVIPYVAGKSEDIACVCRNWVVGWGSANIATHIIAPICSGKARIVMQIVSSPNAWVSLRERWRGGEGGVGGEGG